MIPVSDILLSQWDLRRFLLTTESTAHTSEKRNAKVFKRAHLKLKAIFNQVLCQIDQGEYEDHGNAEDISYEAAHNFKLGFEYRDKCLLLCFFIKPVLFAYNWDSVFSSWNWCFQCKVKVLSPQCWKVTKVPHQEMLAQVLSCALNTVRRNQNRTSRLDREKMCAEDDLNTGFISSAKNDGEAHGRAPNVP